jgi:hypothetical protein
MSRNLSINVNVNPNGVESPTQTRITESTESSQAEKRTSNNGITNAAIYTIARRSIALATSNIGEWTGSRTLQRRLQFGNRIANIGLIALKNPYTAGLLVATQIASGAIQRGLENRDIDTTIRYNQAVRSATYNNSRR